jgi:hypothetical protein
VVQEKIFTGKAAMMYPKQWVVMVELEHENSPYAVSGKVHLVTPNRDEAHNVLRSIRNSGGYGDAMIVEGFDDTPQIGGLFEGRKLCDR